jgi:hypothetical protein
VLLPAAFLLAATLDAAVQGTVRAETTREPIRQAVVEVVQLGRRAITDERGYFVLPGIEPGRWTVRATALGYRPVEKEVVVGEEGGVRVDFELPVQPVEIEGLEALAGPETEVRVRTPGPPAVRVEGRSLGLVPGLVEADVFRALQALPSVAAASDFSSALYVRGGSPDQNLLLLDGAPLFNPFHLGGVFAAFDPSTIATVDVLAGAFPARTGDRLSSAISVSTRDGGRDRVRGQGAIGLISSRASVDGPLPGGRGSYLISARRTYVDLFTDLVYQLGLTSWTVPYAFTDAHLKVTHDVGALGSLSASLYVDREGVSIPERMRREMDGDAEFSWGSLAASLRYRQPFGATLVGEFRVAASAFTGSFDAWEEAGDPDVADPDERPLEQILRARSEMLDVLAGADFTWHRQRHKLGFGLQVDLYGFEHDIGPEDHEFGPIIPVLRHRDRPSTLAAYVEDEWAPLEALQVRAGLRLLHAGSRGTEWLPRVGAQLSVSPRLTLSLGAGRYAQVLRSLRDEESFAASLVAYDLLGAVPRELGLSTGADAVLGAEWRGRSTRVRLDAYVKRLGRLALPPPPGDPMDAPILSVDSLRAGRATARGLELLAQHRQGDLEFSLGYTLAFAELDVAGERYPPRFERRHTLEVTGAAPLGRRGTVSARLALATGQPYTPAIGVTQTAEFDPVTGRFIWGSPTVLLGEHNAGRLPGYLRLDVAARKTFDKRWFGTTVAVTPYLQILNVLNSRNVLFAEPNPYGVLGRPVLEYVPQLPILPTFGVEWRF